MLRRALTGLIAMLLLAGCASYGVYHGPEIVEPGSTEIGVGLMGTRSSAWGPGDPVILPGELSLIARHGVSERVDVGGRLAFFPLMLLLDEPPVVGLYGDVRYRFVDDPLLVTGSIGASALLADDDLLVGAYPTVIAGNERFYAGIRGIVQRTIYGGQSTTDWTVGVVSGAAFGERWIVRPELNVSFAEQFSALIFTPGVSLHRSLGE